MARCLLGSLLLLSAPFPTQAAEDAPEKSIATLIEQLGDTKFKVRQEAVKAIEALGPKTLPALRKARKHRDLETRQRIETLIAQFEIADFAISKHVTLVVSDMPLSGVIDALSRQTGYRIVIGEDKEVDARLHKPCSFRFEDMEFWEVLHRICQQQNLRVNFERNSISRARGLSLHFAKKVTPFMTHHQSFHVAAHGFEYERNTVASRNLRYGAIRTAPSANGVEKDEQPQTTEKFQLQLSIIAEPLLEVYAIRDINITEATDDHNHSLLPGRLSEDAWSRRPPERFVPQLGSELNQQWPAILLQPPAKNARLLKVIRGTIQVYVEKDKKTTVITDDLGKAKGKKFQVDDLTIEVGSLYKAEQERFRPPEYYLSLTVSNKAGIQGLPPGSHDEFELQDAAGNWYQAVGFFYSTGATEHDLRIDYADGRFLHMVPGVIPNPLGPPSKLVYVKSTLLVYSVPFEFKDLPLK